MDSSFNSAQVNFCVASAVGEVTALKQFPLSVENYLGLLFTNFSL